MTRTLCLLTSLIIATFTLPVWSDDGGLAKEIHRAVTQLSDKDPQVRLEGAETLDFLGPLATSATRHLAKALDDKSLQVRQAAGQALKTMGPKGASGLATAFRRLSTRGQVAAVEILATYIAKSPPAQKAVVRYLGHSSPKVRLAAVAAVSGWRGRDKMAVATLVKRLGDVDTEVVDHTKKTLATSGAKAVAPLVKALSHQRPIVRRRAAHLLGQLGAPAKPAVPHLAKALSDKDTHVRTAAARSLGRLQLVARKAVPQLIQALGDQSPQVRCDVIWALSFIGADEARVKVVLKRLEKDGDPKVRKAVQEGLASLKSGLDEEYKRIKQLHTHLDSLSHINAQKREAAITALVQMGERTVPPLVKMTNKDNPIARLNAVKALQKMGKDKWPPLVRLSKHRNPKTREQAMIALSELGEPAIPHLLRGLKDRSEAVSHQAKRGLKKHTLKNPFPLVDNLKSTQEHVRTNSIFLLKQYKNRQHMIPKLQKNLWNTRKVTRKDTFVTLSRLKAHPRARFCDLVLWANQKMNRELRKYATLELHWLRVQLNGGPPTRHWSSNLLFQELGRALRHKNPFVRKHALDYLDYANSHAKPAINDLIWALTHWKSHLDKKDIAKVLGGIGPSALPALNRLLRHSKTLYRKLALLAISEMMTIPPSEIPHLAKAASDTNKDVRLQALIVMEEHLLASNCSRPCLCLTAGQKKSLTNAPPVIRKVYLQTQCYTRVFLTALKDKDPDIRVKGAHLLGKWMHRPHQVIPALAQVALTDSHPMVQRFAVATLGKYGRHLPIIAVILDKALDIGNVKIRLAVVGALDSCREAPHSIPLLVKALQDKSPLVRKSAFSVLLRASNKHKSLQRLDFRVKIFDDTGKAGKTNLQEKTYQRIFAKYLDHCFEEVKRALPSKKLITARPLFVLGSTAKPLVPKLKVVQANHRTPAGLKRVIKKILTAVQSPSKPSLRLTGKERQMLVHQYVGLLVKELKSQLPDRRRRAALALAVLGAKAQPAVPILKKLLSTSNTQVKEAAHWALKKIQTP